jgi:hypothetical protein
MGGKMTMAIAARKVAAAMVTRVRFGLSTAVFKHASAL